MKEQVKKLKDIVVNLEGSNKRRTYFENRVLKSLYTLTQKIDIKEEKIHLEIIKNYTKLYNRNRFVSLEHSQWISINLKDYQINIKLLNKDIMKIEDWFKDISHTIERFFILIEDSLINIAGILLVFNQFMRKGDYIVFEDMSSKKIQCFEEAIQCNPELIESLYVDQEISDLFAFNPTSSRGYIFKTMSHEC